MEERKYNEEATEKLKNLRWFYDENAGASDNHGDWVISWQRIKPYDAERCIKSGADIYTQMPNGSRWIDNIIIIRNIPVLVKLIELNAIDCADKENLAKTCWELIENHERAHFYPVYRKVLGEKTMEEIQEMKQRYSSNNLSYEIHSLGMQYIGPQDYSFVFKKLFQKGLNPYEKIGEYESLFAMCDERIRRLQKGYYYDDSPLNIESAQGLKNLFSTYKKYAPLVKHSKHKNKGLDEANNSQKIQQK